MQHRTLLALALLLALPIGAAAATLMQTLQPNDTLTVTAAQCDLVVTGQSASQVQIQCGPQWTPTALPPTATTIPATATSVGGQPGQPCPAALHPSTGWHPPVHSSGCYFQHEHGDAPPSWVAGAFTQARESHVGYKGALATMSNGVESYLITHILATEGARSHGDHDYALWIRDPSGGISTWSGALVFSRGSDMGPTHEATADDGIRPIVVSVGPAPDGGSCETWYSDPAGTPTTPAIIDVGWTICGRYQGFSGTILGGTGTYRGMDWILPKGRLTNPAFGGNVAPTLAQYAVTEYGVQRFSWLVPGHQYPQTGVQAVN